MGPREFERDPRATNPVNRQVPDHRLMVLILTLGEKRQPFPDGEILTHRASPTPIATVKKGVLRLGLGTGEIHPMAMNLPQHRLGNVDLAQRQRNIILSRPLWTPGIKGIALV